MAAAASLPPAAAAASLALITAVLASVPESAGTVFVPRKRNRGTGQVLHSGLRRFRVLRSGVLDAVPHFGNARLARVALGFRGCRLHLRRLLGRFAAGRLRKHLAALLLHFLHFSFYRSNDVVVIFLVFQKIADVEEGVAIQPDVYEGRLHAGKHACYTAFVDTAD